MSKRRYSRRSYLHQPSQGAIEHAEGITLEHVAHLMDVYWGICDDVGVDLPEMNLADVHEEFKNLFGTDSFLKLFGSTAGQGYLVGAWEHSGMSEDDYEEVIVISE